MTKVLIHDFIFWQDQEEQAYFAVFDGHGGVDAAIYASIHLHVSLVHQEMFQHDPLEALCKAFRVTDERFVQKAAREVSEHQQLKEGGENFDFEKHLLKQSFNLNGFLWKKHVASWTKCFFLVQLQAVRTRVFALAKLVPRSTWWWFLTYGSSIDFL